jgi:NADH dehydrogenase FAD-containing subunit
MTTSDRKNIVILGGSYAGISTAHYLLKHVVPNLSSPSSYHVILVSPSSHVMCRPACPRALISDEFFNQDKLFVQIQKLFSQYPQESFTFTQGTATSLDHVHRRVSVQAVEDSVVEEIGFHALTIATGASSTSPLLGFSPASGHNTLQQHWAEFRKVLPTAKHIVIAGGGPSGVETAGEIGEYLNGRAGWLKTKLENPQVKITIVCASERILPILRPGLAKTAESILEKVGVEVVKNTRVVSLSPPSAGATAETLTSNTTVTLSNGEAIEADLYIPSIGTRPNTSFIPKELLASDDRVNTNPQTLRVDGAGPRIYSLGDCSSAFRPAVHIILEAVPVLAANMKRDLLLAEGTPNSTGGDRVFKEDTRETQLVPIGQSKGVGAVMGWSLPSWCVWLIKGRDYWLWTTGGLWSGKQWAKET